MNTPSFLQEPQLMSLQTLLGDLRSGSLLVPRFQREFVWDPERRINLLDSIEKGIPLGSLLVWRTTVEMAVFPRIGGVPLPERSNGPWQYLLDGHQRVSTLFSAFQPESQSHEGKREDWELEPGDIVYDLADERFLLRKDYARIKRLNGAKGLDLYLLFAGAPYMKFLRDNQLSDELIQRADILADKFRNYKLPVVPLVTDDLPTVLEAFQRINSSGVIMSDAHIVHALSYSDRFDLMERLTVAVRELADIGWDGLEQKYILAVIRALGGQTVTSPDARETADRLIEQPELVDSAVQAIRRVAEWLWDKCRVASPVFLPYSYQLPLMASIFGGLTDNELEEHTEFFQKWFWKASLTGIFRSMRENDYLKARDNLKSRAAEFEAFERSRIVGLTKGKYYFKRARVKIVMLRMLLKRLQGKSHDDISEARVFLGQCGAGSMKDILKNPKLNRSDAGSKFIAIKSGESGFIPTQGIPGEFRADLFVNETCQGRLEEGDISGFYDERTRLIEEWEKEFINSVGLDANSEDAED